MMIAVHMVAEADIPPSNRSPAAIRTGTFIYHIYVYYMTFGETRRIA